MKITLNQSLLLSFAFICTSIAGYYTFDAGSWKKTASLVTLVVFGFFFLVGVIGKLKEKK